jgi:ketosteroid isomerase-like protein
MKHALNCLPALMLAFASAAQAAPLAEADRKALEKLAAANDAAWNAKDVSTMSGQYADDGTVRVSPASPVIAGKGPVAIFFGEAFGRRQGTYRHITSLDHIEAVAPDMALADASVRVEQQQADGSWSLVRNFRNISLVVREGGEWKLRAVRAIPQN